MLNEYIMCSTHWPKLLDMSRDECKRMLRSLELEAYSSMVTAFRAQGDLNKPKQKLLQDLQSTLSISTERHRAEIRRATNDEKLTTIADNIAGPDVSSEWLIEGRRLVPLMPRLVPQTAFTVTANDAAKVQAERNFTMPSPSYTANLDAIVSATEHAGTSTGSNKMGRPSSPTSNVVVLPSGMSIHIKGGLNTDEEDVHGKRRRRSSSAESIVMTRTNPVITTVQSASKVSAIASASNSIQGITPMKITVPKSPAKSHTTTVTPAQKVIIVSSSASAVAGSNVIHKSVQIPVVKAGSTTTVTSTTFSQPRPSIVLPSSSNINMATHNVSANTMATPGSYVTTTYTTPRPRLKHITTTRQKTPQLIGGRSGIILPVGSSNQVGTPSMQNIQIRPVTKPTIHIKQEGSMKIITQGIPGGTSKILPKPTGGAPVVVVTTVPSSVHIAKGLSTTGKVLNFSTAGGRLIATATSRGTAANVVTVNPKTLQLTTVRGATGGATMLTGSRIATPTGAKPNVIVVQKAQPKRSQTPTTPTTIHISKSSASSSPFEKELVSFIQRQDTLQKGSQPQKFNIQKGANKPTVEVTKRPIVVRQHATGELSIHRSSAGYSGQGTVVTTMGGRSSLLAELIQAVGIGPESIDQASEEVVITEDSQAVAAITGDQPSKDAGPNQWVEYDIETAPTEELISGQEAADSTDDTAIKALLDLGANSQSKAQPAPSTSLSLGAAGEPQQDFLTLEQVQNMIANQTVTVQPVNSSRTSSGQLVRPSSGGVHIQMAGSQALGQLTSLSQEELAELDPQTGLFYTTAMGTMASGNTSLSASTASHVHNLKLTDNGGPATSKHNIDTISGAELADSVAKAGLGQKQMDFLTSALNQAQIDLDPYQFIEEDEPSFPAKLAQQQSLEGVSSEVMVSSESQGPLVSILSPQSSLLSSVTHTSIPATQATTNSIVLSREETHVTEDVSFPLPEVLRSQPATSGMIRTQVITTTSQPSNPVRPKSFIPIQDVLRKATTNITVVSQASPSTPTNVAVAVEPTGATGLDATHMKIEDFTSQLYNEQSDVSDLQQEDTSPFGSPTSLSTGTSLSDSQDSHSMRLGKRKRKPPPTPDEITTQSSVGGWVRIALGLLQRVCRFRGSYKEKGEMNAASWFTRPVDPNEVPDYYEIIRNPIDFGTIKKKLEAGHYHDWEDYHADMIQVRDNCFQYNPMGTDVRRDCEEVFSFYLNEYDKALVKWQQTHVAATSPSGKKFKLTSSPVANRTPLN